MSKIRKGETRLEGRGDSKWAIDKGNSEYNGKEMIQNDSCSVGPREQLALIEARKQTLG